MAENKKEPNIKAYKEIRDIGAKYNLSKRELIGILKEILELLHEEDAE